MPPHVSSTVYSKHVEAWNKLIVKQKLCALSWLITNIILSCTVSKTSKSSCCVFRSIFRTTLNSRLTQLFFYLNAVCFGLHIEYLFASVCSTAYIVACKHTVPYRTIPYHTVPYRTVPYHTVPYHTVPVRTTVILKMNPRARNMWRTN